jgi:hypothetical protein
VNLDSQGIDGARRLAVNAQPADQVGSNLASVAPFISLSGVIGWVVVFAARPAPRHFSLGRRAQQLEFGFAQLAKAGLRQSHKINNLLLGGLGHHRHLF